MHDYTARSGSMAGHDRTHRSVVPDIWYTDTYFAGRISFLCGRGGKITKNQHQPQDLRGNIHELLLDCERDSWPVMTTAAVAQCATGV